MTDLHFTARTGKTHLPYLRRMLPRAVGEVARAPREISIALVGDTVMARLHEQFMDIAGPTDVLTFELDHAPNGRVIAGEVVVCVPYAKREAARRKHGVAQELLLYALHGVLHLSGYDDRTEPDHRRMHRREDQILHRIGIGPLFADR
ncbi:MAG: rRNA maturation RNase YbeY [Tepidisphaeraceae bacterium]